MSTSQWRSIFFFISLKYFLDLEAKMFFIQSNAVEGSVNSILNYIDKESPKAYLIQVGRASGAVDDDNFSIYRVDVKKKFQKKGLGLALIQALLQCAIRSKSQLHGYVSLIADERETENLRTYYAKMGFRIDEEYGATDHALQFPMKARIDVVITNLQIWRAARYSSDAGHMVAFQ